MLGFNKPPPNIGPQLTLDLLTLPFVVYLPITVANLFTLYLDDPIYFLDVMYRVCDSHMV